MAYINLKQEEKLTEPNQNNTVTIFLRDPFNKTKEIEIEITQKVNQLKSKVTYSSK